MSDVPCKDCIVLPICKSLIGTGRYYDVSALAHNKNCSLLLDYIDSHWTRGSNRVLINKARVFFGLSPVSWY